MSSGRWPRVSACRARRRTGFSPFWTTKAAAPTTRQRASRPPTSSGSVDCPASWTPRRSSCPRRAGPRTSRAPGHACKGPPQGARAPAARTAPSWRTPASASPSGGQCAGAAVRRGGQEAKSPAALGCRRGPAGRSRRGAPRCRSRPRRPRRRRRSLPPAFKMSSKTQAWTLMWTLRRASPSFRRKTTRMMRPSEGLLRGDCAQAARMQGS
mmetsp:Transcript_19/g.65  ORF Transcript_19/g.65 Transcript_19/m.65 type:complete len:211 (-) Transcript_19:8-640(-)